MVAGPLLRRSYRWRLQLGLWSVPNRRHHQHQPQQPQQQQHELEEEDASAGDDWTLKELLECNKTRIQEQRRVYQELLERHQQDWKMILEKEKESQEENEVKEETAVATEMTTETTTNTTTTNTAAIPDDVFDPLTAMVMEQEAKEKRRQELDLKYRKERARRKRGAAAAEGTNGEEEHDLDAYSSSQTRDVIDKDLHRLPPDHHTYHHSRKNLQRHQHDDSIVTATTSTTTSAKNNTTTKNNDDLFQTSVQERTAQLTQLLLIYAREHPQLGYRQGMHEIASYLLLVLEMDLFDWESSLETDLAKLSLHPSTTTTSTVPSLLQREQDNDNHDDDDPEQTLLHPSHVTADAYAMMTVVMEHLAPAYDVRKRGTSITTKSPMEVLSQHVLLIIQNHARDTTLHSHLQRLHCPPELYCTRWVRLMLSREVAGWRNVLLLWDVLLDAQTEFADVLSMPVEKYTRPGVSPSLQLGGFSLLQVLEAAAASMILLQREKLLQHTASNNNDPSRAQQESQNDSIHILMNVTPLENILPLTATLLSLLRRIQVGGGGGGEGDNQEGASMIWLQQLSRDAASSFRERARGALQQMGSAESSLRKLYNSSALKQETVVVASDHSHKIAAATGALSSSLSSPPRQAAATPSPTRQASAKMHNKGDPLLGMPTHTHPTSPTPRNRQHPHRETSSTSMSVRKALASVMRSNSASFTEEQAHTTTPTHDIANLPSAAAAATTTTTSSNTSREKMPARRKDARDPWVETLKHSTATLRSYLSTMHSEEEVPEAVWDALAKIDLVRQEMQLEQQQRSARRGHL